MSALAGIVGAPRRRSPDFLDGLPDGAELVGGSMVREGPAPADAILTESGQLRELYGRVDAEAGFTRDDPREMFDLVDAKLPPLAGGATGAGGAAFMHNLPPEGSYIMDSTLFFRETERNDVPQQIATFTGLGGAPIDQRISNVGILSKIRLVCTLSMVVAGGGTVTANYPFPWNIIKRFTLNANGQTSLINCEGLDLRARERRMYRNSRDQVSAVQGNVGTSTDLMVDPAPGVIANGTYSITLVYDVPIVHDDYTLTGSIFAQSDQTYLNWRITPAASSELFTLAGGSTAVITGTIASTLTFFDIPYYDDAKAGRKVLIPDLQWLHGYLAADLPFANTGRVRTPFIRTAGQLLSYTFYADNGGAAVISPAALNSIEFGYGGNRAPRVFNPPAQLLAKNAQDYNGRILPNAGVAILDFEVDNPIRDVVYPKGVAELALTLDVPTSVTVNANAHLHFVEETLFAGR